MEKSQQRVAIYTRVSTMFQIDGDSLAVQRKDLTAYSELMLGITDYEIFEDAGYSGKNTDRPAYQQMMERIRNHEFTHLLVWKIDRISRNLIDFSEIYSELKRLRVVFISKNEQFDTSTAIGEAILKIILVFAELERKTTSERVTATMIGRASQGRWNGGTIPYGYDYDKDTKTISVNENEAKVCCMIVDDYLRNKSLLHTAHMLNEQGIRSRNGSEWSQSTVRSIIRNPFYVGDYQYNRYHGSSDSRIVNDPDDWILYENHHPAIYDRDTQMRMIAISDENKTVQNTEFQHNRRKNTHVFARICFCGYCGSRMSAAPGRTHIDGYMTSVYTCRRKKTTHTCSNPALIDLSIGEFVINYIANVIATKKSFSAYGSEQELEKRLLQGSAFKDVVRIEGLYELYDLLSRYKTDKSFVLIKKQPKIKTQKKGWLMLKKEQEKYERALKRLQDAYLFSDEAMSEKDYIKQRKELVARIEELNEAMAPGTDAEEHLSDEEFIRKASHLLVNSRLQGQAYINYKELAESTSLDVLAEYMRTIIDRIYITDKKITSIVFKNGIENRFIYK